MSKHLAVGTYTVYPQKNYWCIKNDFQNVIINDAGVKEYNVKASLLEGSSRSGKTYDISLFIWELVNTFTGKQIVIARDTFASLKNTVFRTLKKAWIAAGCNPIIFGKEPTTLQINGNEILFVTLNNDTGAIHGLDSYILWINELQTCDREKAQELIQRNQRFMIFDYNPNMVESWIYELPKNPKYRLHKSTFRDNKFISQNELEQLLSYEPTPRNIELGTANEYRWRVYGLGERAVNEDAIFKGIKRYETLDMASVRYSLIGVDFGYSVDPTAVVMGHRVGHKWYFEVLMYQLGVLPQELGVFLNTVPGIKKCLVVCDRSAPKDIDTLKLAGIGAYPAKTANIVEGLEKMMESEIYLKLDTGKDGLNKYAEIEFTNYVWKKDKNGHPMKNGKGQPIPIDKFNHLIDAMRYIVTFYSEKKI